MKVKIINKSNNPLPEYKTVGSAGADLHAFLNEEMIIKQFERKMVPTGLYIEIPNGYEAQIRGRSSLGLKHGVTLANAVGTIDSDYRGEINVILINLGKEEFIIKNGDRIAQIIFAKVEQADFIISTDLEETKRGEKGFGSTGK